MNEYVTAKSNIAKYQSPDDTLIYSKDNRYAVEIADKSVAHKIGYPNTTSAHILNDSFYYDEQKICSIDQLRILGRFNQMNACAAIDAVWPFTQDVSAISAGINQFKGLPHRLQFVREFEGVSYYDDSIATIPGAAIAALKSFDEPKIMILGGSSKGSDFSNLAKEMKNSSVRAVLIGDEADKIAQSLDIERFKEYEIIYNPTMSKIVAKVRSLAAPGSVVLLSPAAASFGLFKNYTDRGEQFIDAVNKLN
jgi:UDP-N-acetylmuramoylalanine--D-glutamate ligase